MVGGGCAAVGGGSGGCAAEESASPRDFLLFLFLEDIIFRLVSVQCLCEVADGRRDYVRYRLPGRVRIRKGLGVVGEGGGGDGGVGRGACLVFLCES